MSTCSGRSSQAVAFESSLVTEHGIGGRSPDGESALLINPAANSQTLLTAAKARMQATHDGLVTLMTAEQVDTSLSETLRPYYHLTDEVSMLLEALSKRLADDRKGGAA